jgi:RHS repeat-associated protein
LISAAGSGSNSGSWGDAYGYDGFGNLISKTPTAGSAPGMSIVVDANNHMGGEDANGNQTQGSFIYDPENRLLGTNAIRYAYDSQNKRVWAGTTNGSNGPLTGQTASLYGIDGQLLGTYTISVHGHGLSDAPANLHVYFGGKRVSVISGNQTAGFVQDRLGSNGASNVSLYPWGEDRGTPGPNDQVKFATYTRDSATLLDYANNRYYSNAYGRFMTPDPASSSGDPSEPQSWNRYAYTRGDPVNLNDPSGLNPEGDEGQDPCSADPTAIGCQPPTTGTQSAPGPDCDALTRALGFRGLTYQNASEIWNDGNLSTYSSDSTAAVIAAVAAVTWQGESSFQTNPINNPNYNRAGILTSVDYGPLQINQYFHSNSDSSVWGTSGAKQPFNGDPDANKSFGISILESLYKTYGDTAAGHYVGSLNNWTTTTPTHKAGTPINPSAQKREGTWNTWSSKLIGLFSNIRCFSHI